MEADDILADQVQVCRPEILILLGMISIGVISAEGDIIRESIQPNIYYRFGIKIYRDPPGERSPVYTQIRQARFYEIVNQLIFPGFLSLIHI